MLPIGTIQQTEAAEVQVIERDRRVSAYLLSLARLCVEVARHPRLLPLFIDIITLVPGTIRDLERGKRRIAA